MPSKLEELINIQKEIDEASYKIAKLEGENESHESRLKKKYNCKNTRVARAKIIKLRKRLKEKRSANEQALRRLIKVFKKNQ